MTKYQKPQVIMAEFSSNENIASLSTWLSTNGLTEAGITTYLIAS